MHLSTTCLFSKRMDEPVRDEIAVVSGDET